MKLKELSDLLRTDVRFAPCLSGAGHKFSASLHRTVVLLDGSQRAAVGFGNTKAKALKDLVDELQREAIEYRPNIGGPDVVLDLIRIKLKPGKVSDFT